jgi:hypothetical protein
MIIDVWRPRFETTNSIKRIKYFELVDVNLFLEKKNKGYIVRFLCDKCKSKTINTTTSHSLFNEEYKLNTINNQTCRSCRTKISEFETKHSFINFDIIKKSFQDNLYNLITYEEDYMLSDNKSQYKLQSVCPQNHSYIATWNNWNKGKRCRVCYETEKHNNAVKYKEGWELYRFQVMTETQKTYRKFKKEINPFNLKRGIRNYHIDHKLSIHDGFKLNIPPKIIGSKYNLEMLTYSENTSKGKKSVLNSEELINKFENNKNK